MQHFVFENIKTQFLSPKIDSLGTLGFHVTADNLCDTSLCHVWLQTLKHSPLFLFRFFTQAYAHLFIRLWLNHSDNIGDWASAITKEDKKIHWLFDSTDMAFCCVLGWSFSLCVLLSLLCSSFLSLTSLPAVFNGWVEAGVKERVSETDSEEKKDKGDEDRRERGEGSRQGFNEESLKFAVIEQHPCPLQKGPTSLWRHGVISSPFPFSIYPSDSFSFVSVNSMWDLCLLFLLQLAPFTTTLLSSPFEPHCTSCPLWSGHGSCL